MQFIKVCGARDSGAKYKDSILISHPFEPESQERSVTGDYPDMKICILQIH